ncbi:MAG: YncE family protein [Caldilineaceae bacterium]
MRGSVDALSVIDLTTQQQIASIPAGDSPEEVVLSSEGNFAYVRFGALGDRGVSVIDLQARKLNAVIDTRKEPSAIAISKASNQIFSLTATDHSTVTFDPESDTYTRSYPNGVQVHFNPDGTHDYTLEPDGRKTVYTYNPGGSIATMGIVPSGDNVVRWLWTFNYANSKLTSITDPANRITKFTIDSKGDLVEAITPIRQPSVLPMMPVICW